jgi:hypothetical protein
MDDSLNTKMQPRRHGDPEKKRGEDNFKLISPCLSPRLCVSALAFIFLFLAQIVSAELRPLTTNHYRIQTDVESSLADDLARRMDGMYDEYSRRLVDFSPQEGNRLFDVYIFQHRGQYLNFTNNRAPNTGGVFMANKALAAFLEGQGRDQLRRTLQHEAFHQFAFSAIGPKLPVWLNEGLAQIFEEGIYDGRNFRIGEIPPRRVRQLQDDIAKRRLFEFRSFMGLSDKQWADNLVDRDRGAVEYNQAWAMAYYLIYAEESPGRPRFRSRLIDMLKLIHEGKDGSDAFVEAFSHNIPGFQQMFSEYARQMQPTPLATSIENQDILADMMIELQAHGRRFSDIGSFRNEIERYQMRITYTRGSLQWSSENNPGRYFHDAEGRDMTGDRLFFATRSGAPLPDLVSGPTDTLQLRTRFTEGKEKVEHEILVEAPNR